MQSMCQERFPLCWALQYQQIDRYWHEWMPDLLRTERRSYQDRVRQYEATGFWPMDYASSSEFHPHNPWGHIINQSVRSHGADKWWSVSFVWPAQQVTTKIKSESTFIDHDAPRGGH